MLFEKKRVEAIKLHCTKGGVMVNMTKGRSRVVAVMLFSSIVSGLFFAAFAETHYDTLRRNFADLRLGMLMHYNMNTFSQSGNVAASNLPVSTYNPTALNPAQWVSCAKQAHMKFQVLTAKHHDGFCIWNTSTTTYNCMNSGVPAAARKDVISLYVQACHDSGIVPGIYMSVQDRSTSYAALGAGSVSAADPLDSGLVTNGRIAAASRNYIFSQLKELITNYGDVPFIVDDGWAWSMGHTVVPYQNFRDTILKFSPNTLFSDLDGLFYPWHGDVLFLENSKGVMPPANNIYASWLSNKTYSTSNGWFWSTGGGSVTAYTTFLTSYVDQCDPYYCAASPNFPPDNRGLLPDNVVTWCQNFGANVSSHLPSTRPRLPAQPPHMEYVITAIGAAATSGTARFAVDGVSDGGFATYYTQTLWTSTGSLPQSVTVDLGARYDSLNMCSYLPAQIARNQATKDSSAVITGYTIASSLDNVTFTNVTLTSGYNGTWVGDITMKHALFNPIKGGARYMKLTATAVRSGTVATISELDFGYSDWPKAKLFVGVKKVEPRAIIPGIYTSPNVGLFIYLGGKSCHNATNQAMVRNSNSVTCFSIDGRKQYQQRGGNLPVVPASFASKSYIIEAK